MCLFGIRAAVQIMEHELSFDCLLGIWLRPLWLKRKKWKTVEAKDEYE